MDNDRIVEIGARALFDEWRSRLPAGCEDTLAWSDYIESRNPWRHAIRAALAAFEEAGLVVVERQALLDAAEIAGSINVEGNQRLASALRAAAKADPQ